MKTSYFAKNGNHKNAVSIAGSCPKNFVGREYKKLAPHYWFFQKYKEDGDKDYYIKKYNDLVLEPLNPEEVYNELGEDAVLLCWEKNGKFCHRHLVAKWFKEKLKNIEISEL